MMKPIDTHRTLIEALGFEKAVSAAITAEGSMGAIPPSRVQGWKTKNRIPVEFWPVIINLSELRGLAFVTPEWLMNTFEPRRVAVLGETESAEAA